MANINSNTPFYLKYRPQRLDELIGQEQVKKTLKAAFENNKLSHAYLFVGPRGSGKTSTARILAKMVNCEATSVILGSEATPESTKKDSGQARMTMDGVPCNKCSTCLTITDGSNLDLIEIDAASNRGIEDIRELRERIKLSPTSAKKKVYIIDEVHMLTSEAFNALLKTLEEPPSHALFILATTDWVKIPQTIMSRVQKLDFKMASPQEMTEALTKIIQEEKIDIDDQALKLLIKKSDGSFRDGVKLLDQVSSLGGKIISKSVDEIFKSSKFDDLLNLVDFISLNKTANALMIISKQQELGLDFKEMTLSLQDLLRNLMLIKNGLGQALVEPLFLEEKYEQLIKLSEKFDNNKLIKVLEILQKAWEQLKYASIQSLPLELAVLEMTQSVILSDSDVMSEESKDLLRMPDSNKLRDSSPPSADQNDGEGENQIHLQPSIIKQPSSNIQHPTSNDDILKLKEKWTFVLETVRPYNFSLEALLRSIKINDCTDTAVIMEVPYSFHQRILEAPKNREILESILSDILGRSIKIATVLGERPQRKEDVANIEVAQDDEIIRIASEIFNSDSIN